MAATSKLSSNNRNINIIKLLAALLGGALGGILAVRTIRN